MDKEKNQEKQGKKYIFNISLTNDKKKTKKQQQQK